MVVQSLHYVTLYLPQWRSASRASLTLDACHRAEDNKVPTLHIEKVCIRLRQTDTLIEELCTSSLNVLTASKTSAQYQQNLSAPALQEGN